MKMYIRAATCVSPVFAMESDPATVRTAVSEQQGNPPDAPFSPDSGFPGAVARRLMVIEPDYSRYIDAKTIRRMSRIVKMGVSAAMRCLHEAGSPLPGALITGTAYGCLEDTGLFLRKMIANREEMLSPTAFIQSTHNTVGAQIALLLKCHSYNNTIVHRAFSLEHSLTEADMLLAEGMEPVLVGAIDEITGDSFALLRRFGAGKTGPWNPPTTRPLLLGEGAAFFLLQQKSSGENIATIDHVATRLKKVGAGSDPLEWISAELDLAGFDPETVRTVLDGSNAPISTGTGTLFPAATRIAYKELCGEFPTAAGFALWLAAVMCRQQEHRIATGPVIIFNCTEDGHHSLIHVSPC